MRKVYFVLPKYESNWKVSLAGMAAPTGPTYLYSFAKSINFGNYDDGRCIDLSIHNEDDVLADIQDEDLVCVTAIVANYGNAIDFLEKAKQKGAITAIGGSWPSVRAKQINSLRQEIVDYVVIGEGEAALQKILLDKAAKGILREKSIALNRLPSLDFSGWKTDDLVMYWNNYSRLLKTGEYGPIPDIIPVFVFYQSSRGCIQKPRCKFCGSRLGNTLVFRTGDQFYSDIEKIASQFRGLNSQIHIFDCSDSFTSILHRFSGNLHHVSGVTFTTYARVDKVTETNAKALAKIGVTKVSLGIESGSNKILTTVGKGTTTEQNLLAVKLLKDVGISVYINLIYGLPGETLSDIKKTVDHFIQLSEVGDVYRVAGRIMTPLPNAEWYFDLLKARQGLRKEAEQNDLLNLSKFQKLWIETMTPGLTVADIQQEHSRLVKHAKQKGISLSSEIARGIA